MGNWKEGRMKRSNLIYLGPNDLERFWEKVDRRGDDECWRGLGATGKQTGYRTFYLHGEYYAAHQISYIIEHGEVPENRWILHNCDHRWCVNNKKCLFAGTPQRNSLDRESRSVNLHPIGGHINVGSSNGQAKLTEAKVIEIHRLRDNGVSQRVVAETFGVSQSLIYMIMTGLRWSHVK